jgi:hypothetical protein
MKMNPSDHLFEIFRKIFYWDKAINTLILQRFFWIFLLTPFVALGQPSNSLTPTPIFGTQQERCILPAAQHHVVNPLVLRAILNVESSLQATAIHRNSNGTVDVGMGQINSIHFQELAKWGITPQKLMDACVSTYVAAWHLKKGIVKYGNTWFGIAAYHSATPEHNARYESLIYRELEKTGAFQALPSR